MALQSSGQIKLSEVASEFGDSAPNSMSEFYRGGSLVGSSNTSVPTSGEIQLGDFYGATAVQTFTLTPGTTTNYNILTAATAAGFTNGSGDNIVVNCNGLITGSPAMRTGAINGSNITVNILSGGRIDGDTGSTGTSKTCATSGSCVSNDNGTAGGAGGDAIYWETSGSATNTVNVNSGGSLRGGGGGGGGGGAAARQNGSFIDKGSETCQGNTRCGVNGSAGSAGAFGAAGSAGTDGVHPTSSQWPGESFPTECRTSGFGYCAPGTGGAGGAAGFALRKNSRSVTLNNSGTVAGSTS